MNKPILSDAVQKSLLDILNKGNALILQATVLEVFGLIEQSIQVRKRLYYWSRKLHALAIMLPHQPHKLFYMALADCWLTASQTSFSFQALAERIAV